MAQSERAPSAGVLTVLDPRGQPTQTVQPLPLSPRLDTVEGKTIYLVDVGFGGGYEFLEEVAGWFARNKPSVKTILRRKKGNMFMDDPELWAQIKDTGHAVIFGVGG
jgi:hypothetical protein